MRVFLFVIYFLTAVSLNAQCTEVLRGVVTEAISSLPVQGAVVNVLGNNERFAFVTDSAGRYKAVLHPGLYRIEIIHPTYVFVIREEVRVSAGHHETYDFSLEYAPVQLDTLAVQSSEPGTSLELNSVLNQKLAAVFYDPARVVNSHAGAVNTDDQANNISVRGSSPNFVQWKIEGVEVVNPNHLENAGMLSDRPAFNGGGVSMISNQMMQQSAFYFSPFNASHGNALSGIFDIRLRTGNDERSERTIQASLLGTDVCLEGPFKKGGRASYIVNARYSTVGLLSLMGVNFGDEKINFTDLSYQISIPFARARLRFFGIAGYNTNDYNGIEDTASAKYQKELTRINYKSSTLIQGVAFSSPLSEDLFFKASAAYSVKQTNRTSAPFSPRLENVFPEQDDFSMNRYSSVFSLNWRFHKNAQLKAGSYVNMFEHEINSVRAEHPQLIKRSSVFFTQPFMSVAGRISSSWRYDAGVHSMYVANTNAWILQPRAQLTWQLHKRNEVQLQFARNAQLQPFYLFMAKNNEFLSPAQSDAYTLSHRFFTDKLSVLTEFYFQKYFDLAVGQDGFSAFNYVNGPVYFSLSPEGEARCYGGEVTVKRTNKGFYLTASAGIFKSEYLLAGVYKPSRYSADFNTAVSAGNEFELKDKRKSWGFHLRSFVRGGFRETASSHIAGSNDLNSKLPMYFRTDLRVSYTKQRIKSSYVWALEIQNVSASKSIIANYYDHLSKTIEPRYQLGLIPVLSYKVYF